MYIYIYIYDLLLGAALRLHGGAPEGPHQGPSDRVQDQAEGDMIVISSGST